MQKRNHKSGPLENCLWLVHSVSVKSAPYFFSIIHLKSVLSELKCVQLLSCRKGGIHLTIYR